MEIETGLKEMGWGSAEHLHAAIESMRLGFVDTLQYNADPQVRLCSFSGACLIFGEIARMEEGWGGPPMQLHLLADACSMSRHEGKPPPSTRNVAGYICGPSGCVSIVKWSSFDGVLSCTGGACANRRPA